MTELGESIEAASHKTIFGVPEDIALVLAIDAILISMRLAGIFTSNRFIGAKVVGTTALIAAHFMVL
tara:strand:+ start:1088 stop:1288 length:201 start_codon:yes stop_codon:yes gene_type:complete